MRVTLKNTIYSFVLLGIVGMNNQILAATELSKKIVTELKNGDRKKTKKYVTDNFIIVYSPDPFTESGNCRIAINYFDGKEIRVDAHPRLRVFYNRANKGEVIAIPNFISAGMVLSVSKETRIIQLWKLIIVT